MTNAPLLWPSVQDEFPMSFDPATGKRGCEPLRATEYRHNHGLTAWLYNPWTGQARDPRDIGSDVDGRAIVAGKPNQLQAANRVYDPSQDDVPFDFRYEPKTGNATFKADGFQPVQLSIPFQESYDLFKMLKEAFQRAAK